MSSERYLRLQKAVETYIGAVEVNSRLMRAENGRIVTEDIVQGAASFCSLLHESGCGLECQHCYRYGAWQAEKLGEAYIYFCPYGLVNWSVPPIPDDRQEVFLVGGPVLMHPVDDLLLQQIFRHSPQLHPQENLIRQALNKLTLVEPSRVRHLSELLWQVARGYLAQELTDYAERRQLNTLDAQMAETIHSLKQGTALLPADRSPIYLLHREKELLSKVSLGDRQGAGEILNEILGFVYFRGERFEVVRSTAIGLMVLLARSAIEIGADLEIIFGLEYAYLHQISGVSDLSELSHVLIKVLDRFMEAAFSLKNVKNRDLIFKAMSFIRRNYQRQLSLDEVACHVGLNAAYFSKLFKQEMSLSYTAYLNKVRIEASKQLLSQGYSLAQAAYQVGFSDQSYFSKVFKKLEGVSPGRWR